MLCAQTCGLVVFYCFTKQLIGLQTVVTFTKFAPKKNKLMVIYLKLSFFSAHVIEVTTVSDWSVEIEGERSRTKNEILPTG